ncbi:unnamed protein product, partial [marine sediment metagenome]
RSNVSRSAAAVCPASALAVWQMDEDAGATAPDETGNGNPVDLFNGPTWYSGKVDNALHFAKGPKQYGTSGNISTLDGATAFSVEFWINPDSLPFLVLYFKYNFFFFTKLFFFFNFLNCFLLYLNATRILNFWLLLLAL